MTEFLAAWDKSREPSFAAFRIVGPAIPPRAHRLRDDLARASVPYWSFDNSSEEGRRLLREHSWRARPSPWSWPGTALCSSTRRTRTCWPRWACHALGTRACDVAIIGAGPAGPGGRGLRGVRRRSVRWCWSPTCPAGRPARVR